MKDQIQLPFEMKRIRVLDDEMAYVDQGQGPTVLFLHGNPTSSYLWRNIIPHLLPNYRCVAPDLIGFGQSDKPKIAYRFEDHARYLQAFIAGMEIDNFVMVLHDWGSALGFDWARRHQTHLRGLAFMEFMTPFPTWLDFGEQGAELFKQFRSEENGRKLLIEDNVFIEKVLPGGVVSGVSDADMEVYRRPFLSTADREPVFRFPNELPVAGFPVDVYAMATAYNSWLLESVLPKLFFWVDPGALISVEKAAWYERKLINCKTVALGAGGHYIQEDYPDQIGTEIVRWLESLG